MNSLRKLMKTFFKTIKFKAMNSSIDSVVLSQGPLQKVFCLNVKNRTMMKIDLYNTHLNQRLEKGNNKIA